LKGFVAAEGNGRIGGREKGASSGEKKEWSKRNIDMWTYGFYFGPLCHH